MTTASTCNSRFLTWLSQPDQFEWVTAFLQQRGLLRPARLLMAAIAASSALTPISALARMHNPPTATLIFGIVGAGVSVAMTIFWLTHWPTRAQSLTAALAGTGCVVGWSLVQPKSGVAGLACTALAITGGYIAFFHNTKVLLGNMVLAFGVTFVAAHRIALLTDVATAVAAFWLITLLNVAVPLAIRGMSRAMAEYAMRSEQDALTGLLNRRGFVDTVTKYLRVGPTRPSPADLSVIMIDLDDFKRINDTRGHLAGDRALLHVAELLRQYLPGSAAVCRAGGEEFLAAFTSASAPAVRTAAQLCTAIETSGIAVTASIGVASAQWRYLEDVSEGDFIDQLIQAADSAMYSAKRNGGNRVEYV